MSSLRPEIARFRTVSVSYTHLVPDVSVEVSAGVRALELKGEILDKGVGAAMDVNIEYGDRFSDENEKPYDYFTFKLSLIHI